MGKTVGKAVGNAVGGLEGSLVGSAVGVTVSGVTGAAAVRRTGAPSLSPRTDPENNSSAFFGGAASDVGSDAIASAQKVGAPKIQGVGSGVDPADVFAWGGCTGCSPLTGEDVGPGTGCHCTWSGEGVGELFGVSQETECGGGDGVGWSVGCRSNGEDGGEGVNV